MRIKAALYNADHLEYGLVTIPFPIPQDQYNDTIKMLEALDIGDPRAKDCTAMNLRYRIKGNVIEPIPSPEGLPQDLQGKFLWLNLSGEAQSAIRQVYVAGTGWVSPGILNRKTEPMPLVLKYRADGINEQGAYLSLEVEPWEYHR